MTTTAEPFDDDANNTPANDGSLTPKEIRDESQNVEKPCDDSDSRSDTPEDGDERVQLYKYVDAQQQRIEKQIIFAGLLSTLLTTHIFSSRWLRADNTLPAPLHFAQQWLTLHGFLNRHDPVQHIMLPPDPLSLRVTAYLLSSVILCLLAIICGAVSLRWWREYLRCLLLPQEVMYDDNFKRRMLMIMSLLPIILQVSVLLVLAGILEILWEWNDAVAAVVTATVGLISLIVLPATAASLFQNLNAVLTTGRAT